MSDAAEPEEPTQEHHPTFMGSLPVWSERWPPEALKRRHRAIGDTAWERGYRQRPFASSDRTFPSIDVVINAGAGMPIPTLDELPPQWRIFTGVDLSGEGRMGVIITTIAMDPFSRRRTLLENRMLKGQSPMIVKALGQTCAKWDPDVVALESNGIQAAFLQWVEADVDFIWSDRFIPHLTTGSNKHDVAIGLPGLEVEMSKGLWVAPAGVIATVAGQRWREEFKDYPNGETDDCVMSTWFAAHTARKYCDAINLSQEDGRVRTPQQDGVFDVPEFGGNFLR